MAVDCFRLEQIEFDQESIVVGDIHGNWSACDAFLDDVNQKHRLRIGNALIDTIDPNAVFEVNGKSIEGKTMRKTLRYIHQKHFFPSPDSTKIRTEKEKAFDNAKSDLNKKITSMLSELPMPKIYGLGDYVDYYGQTRECLDAVKTFDGATKGNHDNLAVLAYNGMGIDTLRESTGSSKYACECAQIVAEQITDEEAEFLEELPDEVEIGSGAIGTHCPYDDKGTPMYPISKKVAKTERYYFKDPSKIELLCQEPEDIFKIPGLFSEGVFVRFYAHSHLPVFTQCDENGNIVMDVTPGRLGIGTQREERSRKNYFVDSFTLPEGHTALVCVGGILSRRKDKFEDEAIDKVKTASGKRADFRQGYYTSFINRTVEFRQIYPDINFRNTLEDTKNAGMKLKPEDQLHDEQ